MRIGQLKARSRAGCYRAETALPHVFLASRLRHLVGAASRRDRTASKRARYDSHFVGALLEIPLYHLVPHVLLLQLVVHQQLAVEAEVEVVLVAGERDFLLEA